MQAAYPATINTGALQALYDNVDQDEEMTVRVDRAIRRVTKAGWRGNRMKEREIWIAMKSVLGADDELVDSIFEIATNQRGS